MAKSKTCKWYNIDETAPHNEQEVLIKCDDGYYVAKYDSGKKGFMLRGNALLTEQHCTIHWMPIVFP
jgi:hypothetical protein